MEFLVGLHIKNQESVTEENAERSETRNKTWPHLPP